VLLEEWNTAKLGNSNAKSIKFFKLAQEGDLLKQKDGSDELPGTEEVVYFDTDANGNVLLDPNTRKIRRIYRPRSQTHPAWDFVFDDGALLVFFQFSITHLDEKLQKPAKDKKPTIAASFDGGPGKSICSVT